MINLVLANSEAGWCDLYVTFPHRTDPNKVLIECQPYQRPVEHWVWTRGSQRASNVGSL